MKKLIFILILIIFNGCVNKKGVSLEYYDDCHLEYDLYGSYSEKCPYNVFDFKKDNKKDCLQCK